MTTIRVRPSLWTLDREAFWRVYLHECAHALKHANGLVWSDGNVLPLVRGDHLRGLLLGAGDAIGEIQADLLPEIWWAYAGSGPIVWRLHRLLTWEEES